MKRHSVSPLRLKMLLDTQTHTHTTAPIVQQNRSDCIGVHSVKSCFFLSLPFVLIESIFFVWRSDRLREEEEENASAGVRVDGE